MHDGVNLGWIDKQPVVDAHATFWMPHGAPVVGNVAALVAAQGPAASGRGGGEGHREEPDARVFIVGEGELREPLERQIKDLGLDRHVFLTGFRTDVLGLMKSFDVFAMSSVTEGLGSAMLEAMACRRPIVATRAGGIPEVVVDGKPGCSCRRTTTARSPPAIVRLLRDPALRQTLGEAGRQRVEDEFSAERMVAKTLAVYEERVKARQ